MTKQYSEIIGSLDRILQDLRRITDLLEEKPPPKQHKDYSYGDYLKDVAVKLNNKLEKYKDHTDHCSICELRRIQYKTVCELLNRNFTP